MSASSVCGEWKEGVTDTCEEKKKKNSEPLVSRFLFYFIAWFTRLCIGLIDCCLVYSVRSRSYLRYGFSVDNRYRPSHYLKVWSNPGKYKKKKKISLYNLSGFCPLSSCCCVYHQAHNRNLLSIDFDHATRLGKIYDDHRKFTLRILYDELGRPVLWSPGSKYNEVNVTYSATGLITGIRRGNWSEKLEYENGRMASRTWVNGKIWSYSFMEKVPWSFPFSFLEVRGYAWASRFTAHPFPSWKYRKCKCGKFVFIVIVLRR